MELIELIEEVPIIDEDVLIEEPLIDEVLLIEAEPIDEDALIEESLEPDEQAVRPITANANTT